VYFLAVYGFGERQNQTINNARSEHPKNRWDLAHAKRHPREGLRPELFEHSLGWPTVPESTPNMIRRSFIEIGNNRRTSALIK
jgi:hypothetical protein